MSKNYYITNDELEKELEIFKKTCKYDDNGKYLGGKMSDTLGRMIILIASNLSNDRCFMGYTWKDDMVAEAVFTCVKYLHNWKKDKSGNPFGYITMISRRAFLNYISRQKKHSNIKDVCFNSVDCLEKEEADSYSQKSIDYTVLKKLGDN